MTFGTVAVSYRPCKAPEPAFVCSLTGLLYMGIDVDDGLLAPHEVKPPHQQSNDIVRAFLASPYDTLLMLDDDMKFTPDCLKRLRHNPANAEYDIVSAFATTRELPAKHLMFRLSEERPSIPLGTDHFQRVASWYDGETVEVDVVGLAFTLIRRRVFETMTAAPYFSYGPYHESDEVPFCRAARGLGFRMAVDTSVKIRHIARLAVGFDDMEITTQ